MTLNIGIFGTGTMAKIYAGLMKGRDDVHLAAVVGNTESTCQEFSKEFGVKVYPNSAYETALANHPEIDALIVAVPEWIRKEPLIAAVNGNKHLLLEKPLADSWEKSKFCRTILSQQEKTLKFCHVLRFSPRFQAMQAALASGQIGDLRHMFARRNSNHVRVKRVLNKTDLAFWLAPHDIDIMRWLTGSEVESVHTMCRNGLKSADDYLITLLRFANGVDATLEISWCAPPLSGLAREAVFEIRGTGGAIELEDFAMNVKVFSANRHADSPDTYEDYIVQGHRYGFFRNLFDDFVGQVVDKTPVANGLEDAFETARVCAMMRVSIDEQRIVKRDELL